MQETIERIAKRQKLCSPTHYTEQPRLKPPAYLHHKASNQAYIRVGGQFRYLGEYGTPASRKAYQRILADWEANGGRITTHKPTTVAEVAGFYLEHVEAKEPSVHHLDRTLRGLQPLVTNYEDVYADEFTPGMLKAIRHGWLSEKVQRGKGDKLVPISRQYVNALTDVIKRAFRYAVENEMCHPDTYARLDAVKHLTLADRTGLPEQGRRNPVSLVDMVNTLWHVYQDSIRRMAILQWFTGARPGEIITMRPCDVDTSGEVWRYTPVKHKTKHFGKSRVILIGPLARYWLEPVMDRPLAAPCFPVLSGDRPYTVQGYRNEIVKGCARAGVKAWTPYQIRHAAASRFADELDLHAAKEQLGHAKIETTLNYVHANELKAIEAARLLS